MYDREVASQLTYGFNLHRSNAMKIQKLTLFLFFLVFGTLGLTFATRNQTQSRKITDTEALKNSKRKRQNSLQLFMMAGVNRSKEKPGPEGKESTT